MLTEEMKTEFEKLWVDKNEHTNGLIHTYKIDEIESWFSLKLDEVRKETLQEVEEKIIG